MDSTIVAALIGFSSAVVGGLVVATANYYFQRRLDQKRKEEESIAEKKRIRDLLLGKTTITVRTKDSPLEITYDPRYLDDESLKAWINEAISRSMEEEE